MDQSANRQTFANHEFSGRTGVTGVVEQVRTGRRERIQSVTDISRVIAAILAGDATGRT
jgi:hypothetical protein